MHFLQSFNLLKGAVVTPNLLSCGIFSYWYPEQWDSKARQGPWHSHLSELHSALQSGKETWPCCQVLVQVTKKQFPLLLRLWKHWDPPIHIEMMKEKCPLPVSGEGGMTGVVEALPAWPTWGNTFNCFQGECNTNICIAGHGDMAMEMTRSFCSRFSKTRRLFNEYDHSRLLELLVLTFTVKEKESHSH